MVEACGGGRKGEILRFWRKLPAESDNPDVLYGRDFEDEPIRVREQVQEEMGEVTVKGQDLQCGQNGRSVESVTIITIDVVPDFTDTIHGENVCEK